MIESRGVLTLRILISIAAMSCAFSCQAQTGQLFLWQHGDTIGPKNGLYEVERDYFEMRLTLGEYDKLILNISPDSSNAVAARNCEDPLKLDWFRNGSGFTEDPNNRVNWLLVSNKDHTIWPRNSKFTPGKLYSDSTAEDGTHLRRLITSFAFYDSGGLNGAYSVFLVPVSRLYLTYTVATTVPDQVVSYTPFRSTTLRLMGN